MGADRRERDPLALYACMLIMPLTGYVASNFSKWGVKYFNTIQLPPWGVDDERVYAFFNGTHVATSYVFVALIVAARSQRGSAREQARRNPAADVAHATWVRELSRPDGG